MTGLGKVRRRLFGIPSAKSVFSRPGFAPEAWSRFEPVAHSLVEGYHATLEDSRLETLVPRLDQVAPEFRGFAYEGAGMGLGALDMIGPWKRRMDEFIAGPGGPFAHPVYVGVGLALARMKRQPESYVERLDPLLGWVIVDGYGFHEGFFRRKKYIDGHAIPTRLSSYAQRIFDQGLGRAIWFSCGAVLDRVVPMVEGFQPGRHADLWSGVGLASAYGGGADRATLEKLLTIASPYQAQLARGAATAAKGREDAGNKAAHTELACEVFCGLTAHDAVRVLKEASSDLPTGGTEPAYEIWRQRTHQQFTAR